MTAWIVRAGKVGEREDWAIENSLAGGGFREFPDLTSAKTRDQVKDIVAKSLPGATTMQQAIATGQCWALRHVIKPGDLIVLPFKNTPKIAIGVCTSGYQFRDDPDITRRHVIGVKWETVDAPRAAVKDDLLSTLNGAMTIFTARKNNAEARLRAMMKTGIDPGSTGVPATTPAPTASNGADEVDEAVADPAPAATPQAIRDRILVHLGENFRQHKLEHLVADVLRAQGWTCHVSPQGPDRGVDILAGRGPLGLDSPTLIVECKSEEGTIGGPVVRGLNGAISTAKADQGLLVAWGGLNKKGREEMFANRLTIATWDAERLLDEILAVYDRLSPETKAKLPLKQVWVLDEETG